MFTWWIVLFYFTHCGGGCMGELARMVKRKMQHQTREGCATLDMNDAASFA